MVEDIFAMDASRTPGLPKQWSLGVGTSDTGGTIHPAFNITTSGGGSATYVSAAAVRNMKDLDAGS